MTPPSRDLDAPDDSMCVAIREVTSAAELEDLCARARTLLLATRAGVLITDVGQAPVDLQTVHAIAKLSLTARRMGRRMQLRHVSPALADLVAFVGLADILGSCLD